MFDDSFDKSRTLVYESRVNFHKGSTCVKHGFSIGRGHDASYSYDRKSAFRLFMYIANQFKILFM